MFVLKLETSRTNANHLFIRELLPRFSFQLSTNTTHELQTGPFPTDRINYLNVEQLKVHHRLIRNHQYLLYHTSPVVVLILSTI